MFLRSIVSSFLPISENLKRVLSVQIPIRDRPMLAEKELQINKGRTQTEASRVQSTLVLSILDGMGYSVMVGAGETYFIPYAIFLGGSNLLLGLFVALPIFVGSLSQIFSERLLFRLGTRKRVICAGALCQSLMFGPILWVKDCEPSTRLGWLLGLVCLYQACGLVLAPSWSSLMGDLVPETERGAYFGRRNRFIQITTFATLLAAGLILYLFKERGEEYRGFLVIFLGSAAARVASLFFLLLHWEPPTRSPPTQRTFSAVAETFQKRDQRALILYLTLMNFGVYLAAPFFSTYMLRPQGESGMGWSYVTYTAINGITVFFKFVFLPLWGRASDRFGARKCLVLAAWFLSTLPLFWLFPREHAGLYFGVICLAQLCGGFAWAGHELCAFNFLLDSARPEDRPRLVASMNIINGVMVFLGSTTGAVMVSLAPGAVNSFLLVFLASGLTRFGVCAALVHRLREVRVVEKISYRALLFRVTAARAHMGPGMRFFVFPAKKIEESFPIHVAVHEHVVDGKGLNVPTHEAALKRL
jgi:MFS family permease